MSKKWLDAARLMVDSDGRDPHEARALIEWSCRDSFWASNILSMPTFRSQYDKLRLARKRNGSTAVDRARDSLSVVAKFREEESRDLESTDRRALDAHAAI